MATPAAILSVLVQADGIAKTNGQLQSLHGDLDKSSKAATRMGDDIDKGSKKGSRALGALKSGAGLAVGALGVVGVAGAVKTMVGEFEEARKVGANTNQVLKSTGGVANVSAKHVGTLSSSISKKVGIDDEAIQSGANLLLTFKNIRNETGKGKDIFDQATKAAVDLSAAGFGSLSSTSKQLGKALNDPVKGMTALGKSGVTFSEDQKKAIEALLATGKAADRVKAQQIILKEVQSQVGGQAAAQATTMDKLKVTLGNLAEAAGSVLVPALDKIGKFLVLVINQMIEGKGAGGAIVSTFRDVGGAVGAVVTIIKGAVTFFTQHKTVTLALAAAATVFAAAYTVTLIPALIASTAVIYAQVAAWVALKVAFLASPIGLVVVALAALVAGLVIAYRESETFRKIIDAAWVVIKVVAAWLITAGVAAFNALSAAVKVAWGVVKTVTETVWNGLKAFLVPLWAALKTVITTYFNAYKTIVTGVWDAIRTVTSTVWEAIKTVATGVWSALKTAATLAWDGIKTAILTPIRAARDLIDGVWDTIKDRAKDAWGKLSSAVGNFAGDLKDGIIGAFKGAANKVIDFVNNIIDAINKIPGVDIKAVGHVATASASKVEGLARGGAFGRTGGLVKSPITLMGEEAPRHPEFVIPTNPAYRKRAQGLAAAAASAVGVQGFESGGIFGTAWDLAKDAGGFLGELASKGYKAITNLLPSIDSIPQWLSGMGTHVLGKATSYIKDKVTGLFGDGEGGGGKVIRLSKMIARMNTIDAKGWPYVYGGGHGSFEGPYDCSGLVSAVLHAGGFPGGIMSTDPLKTWGESGDGKYITVGVRGSSGRNAHTMMKLGDRYLESGSGHGAKWVSGWSGSFPIHRHPEGFAKGGLFEQLFDPKTVGWGLKKGGSFPFVGSYARGGVVPQDGLGYLHRGETVTPAGDGIVLYADIDLGRGIKERIRLEWDDRDRGVARAYRAGVA